MSRIGVTGGRDYMDVERVRDVLKSWVTKDDVLVEGGAHGADLICKAEAMIMGVKKFETHKADWDKFGKGAGPIRNQEMVDSGLDLLLAFPGGRGTDDMIERALKAEVKVVKILDNGGEEIQDHL